MRVTADVSLLVPEDDVSEPEVSIVVPALNEEMTITVFVAWCKEGLRRIGAQGEILIIDSSSDRTPELAVAAGARVLRTPETRTRAGVHRCSPLYIRGTLRRDGRRRLHV